MLIESDPNEDVGPLGSNGVSTIEDGVWEMFHDVGFNIFETLQVIDICF
jgi:hypothetical protein